jgi:hypothetical protein
MDTAYLSASPLPAWIKWALKKTKKLVLSFKQDLTLVCMSIVAENTILHSMPDGATVLS